MDRPYRDMVLDPQRNRAYASLIPPSATVVRSVHMLRPRAPPRRKQPDHLRPEDLSGEKRESRFQPNRIARSGSKENRLRSVPTGDVADRDRE